MGQLRSWNEEPLAIFQNALKMRYIHLYHSYKHYLHQNSLSARDFKTFIRHSDNMPKLFKEEFACESPGTLWAIVFNFIMTHRCMNKTLGRCPKVSYLKCSAWGFAYYCSKQCQIDSWPIHKTYCQNIKNSDKEFGRSRAVIHSHFLKQVDKNRNGDSLLTADIFRKEIERALFTAYLSVVEHTNYLDDYLNMIFSKNKREWIGELQALKRNRYKLKLSSEKFISQLISVYGRFY